MKHGLSGVATPAVKTQFECFNVLMYVQRLGGGKTKKKLPSNHMPGAWVVSSRNTLSSAEMTSLSHVVDRTLNGQVCVPKKVLPFSHTKAMNVQCVAGTITLYIRWWSK